MKECSEPDCRYPATETFRGRSVCYDCLERLRDSASSQDDECEEPGCRYPAVKEFGGKRLCQDCWEKYKAEQDKVELELKRLG
ncbi:hypothetical protein KY363_04755 [Candidatus Woesearchaeota archaeon]|nr:hypothetical protein [Candidatus Woesearchaeota archaeon]